MATERRFTKQTAKYLLDDIKNALAEVEKKHNVKIEFSTGSYGDVVVKTRISATLNDTSVLSREQLAYNFEASMNKKLPPLNSQIETKDGIFEIIGWSTRARRYPIMAKMLSKKGGGKVYDNYTLGVSYVTSARAITTPDGVSYRPGAQHAGL